MVENELGETYRFAHDETGQVTAERDFAGRTLHYGYDLAGRCTKRVNGAGQILTFQLDALGRVVRQINAEGAESVFEYDANGNVVKATSADGVKTEFERNENGQIISKKQNEESLRTTFDALGRRASRRTTRGDEIKWRYDANNLPLELQFASNGEEFSFEYDAASRETSRRLASGLKLEKEYDERDRLTRQSVALDTAANGELRRLAARLSEQTYFYDESGKPLELFDQAGETAWQQTNLWSENVAAQAVQTDCDLRFQGQWFDEESGLHYNFHRYYDPQTGRTFPIVRDDTIRRRRRGQRLELFDRAGGGDGSIN